MSESHAPWPGTVAASPSGERPREILIAPTRGWPTLRLGEIAAYRELLYFLVWRDVKVRYKQTALGVAWAVLQPLLTVVVFTIFFNHVGGIEVASVPTRSSPSRNGAVALLRQRRDVRLRVGVSRASTS